MMSLSSLTNDTKDNMRNGFVTGNWVCHLGYRETSTITALRTPIELLKSLYVKEPGPYVSLIPQTPREYERYDSRR